MFSRINCSATSSVSGTVTPSDSVSMVNALSTAGGTTVTFGSNNASFRCINWLGAPVLKAYNAPARLTIIANLVNAQQQLVATVYKADGTTQLVTRTFTG